MHACTARTYALAAVVNNSHLLIDRKSRRACDELFQSTPAHVRVLQRPAKSNQRDTTRPRPNARMARDATYRAPSWRTDLRYGETRGTDVQYISEYLRGMQWAMRCVHVVVGPPRGACGREALHVRARHHLHPSHCRHVHPAADLARPHRFRLDSALQRSTRVLDSTLRDTYRPGPVEEHSFNF